MHRIVAGAQQINKSGNPVSIFKRFRRSRRPLGARIMIGKRLLLHGLVALTAVAGVAALAALDAVPALANNPVHAAPSLTLSNASGGVPGQWAASGNTYARGLGDVQIWVMNVTDGGWSTVEYQSGLATSSYSIAPYNPGGLFSAAGETKLVLVDPDVGYRREAVDPLTCGHSYQAVTDDPTDGYVYSNVLTEAACQ
jgi:hypothetical protein